MERKTLNLALEALESDYTFEWPAMQRPERAEKKRFEAITAIREALAQPAQEPVGKFAKFTDGIWHEVTDGSPGVPLYTAPPQQVIQSYSEKHNLERTWVDLTPQDLNEIFAVAMTGEGAVNLARAKLKELNHE